MLKSFAFQIADLLWCGKPLIFPLVQPIEDFGCLTGILDLIRHDTQLLQGMLLFIRRRPHFPAKRRHIIGQVLCLDGHFKL